MGGGPPHTSCSTDAQGLRRGAPDTSGLSFPASRGSPGRFSSLISNPTAHGLSGPSRLQRLGRRASPGDQPGRKPGQGRVTRVHLGRERGFAHCPLGTEGRARAGAPRSAERGPPPRRRMLRAERTKLTRQTGRPPAAEAPGPPGQGTPTVILPLRWLREQICCGSGELSHLKVATAWRTLGGDFPHDCGDKGTA